MTLKIVMAGLFAGEVNWSKLKNMINNNVSIIIPKLKINKMNIQLKELGSWRIGGFNAARTAAVAFTTPNPNCLLCRYPAWFAVYIAAG